MTHDDPRNDDVRDSRLAKLIAASRAEANPAVLARARARIAAREGAPRVALWLARPAVLAGAGALFVACLAGTFVVSRQAGGTSASSDTSLISSLVGEEDLGLPIMGSDAASGGAAGGAAGDAADGTANGDSGEVAQ